MASCTRAGNDETVSVDLGAPALPPGIIDVRTTGTAGVHLEHYAEPRGHDALDLISEVDRPKCMMLTVPANRVTAAPLCCQEAGCRALGVVVFRVVMGAGSVVGAGPGSG